MSQPWHMAQTKRHVRPLPASQASFSFQMVHSSHQISREHGAQRWTGMEYTTSFRKLVFPTTRNLGVSITSSSRVSRGMGQNEEDEVCLGRWIVSHASQNILNTGKWTRRTPTTRIQSHIAYLDRMHFLQGRRKIWGHRFASLYYISRDTLSELSMWPSPRLDE